VVRRMLCGNSVANINNSGSCFVRRDENVARNMRWIVERGGNTGRATSWSTRRGRAAADCPVDWHITS
jgi:hypothetical protein